MYPPVVSAVSKNNRLVDRIMPSHSGAHHTRLSLIWTHLVSSCLSLYWKKIKQNLWKVLNLLLAVYSQLQSKKKKNELFSRIASFFFIIIYKYILWIVFYSPTRPTGIPPATTSLGTLHQSQLSFVRPNNSLGFAYLVRLYITWNILKSITLYLVGFPLLILMLNV